MQTLLSLSFWITALLWAVSSFLIFIVPGLFIQKKLRIELPSFAKFGLSLAMGLGMWGAQGYIFGYMHARFMTYMYVVLCICLGVKERAYIRSCIAQFMNDLRRFDKVVICILLVGILLQTLQVVGTGLLSSQGMAFWRVNMQDGVYHMSLITGMVRSFPPPEPGFAGHLLINYHYWSDLIFADQVRIFHIPVENLFFQFVPFLLSFATGIAVCALLQTWNASKHVVRFALFFLFFGADAGYIVAFLIHRVWSFQYPVIDTGVLQFLNIPHVVAKFVFLVSLVPLYHWLKTKQMRWGGVSVALTALLFGLKIYFALYAVLGLVCIGCIVLIRSYLGPVVRRKEQRKLLVQMMLLGICGGVGALAIYLPPNQGSGGLTLVPLAWPQLMLAQDNLDWTNWRYKFAIAQLLGFKSKMVLYHLQAILVTLVAIHGTRLLGFLVTKKFVKALGIEWVLYFLVPTTIFTFLGLYTMQVSGGYNVFNFFAMSLTLLSLSVGYLAGGLWEAKYHLGKILVVILLILTLPRVVYETQKIITSYQEQTDVLYISKAEMETLYQVDRQLPKTCILATSPNNEVDMKTPYVSFYSARITYMSGQSVLETHSQPSLERYLNYRNLFTSKKETIVNALRSYGVCALYVKKEDELFGKMMEGNPPVFFQNDLAAVIKVQ